MLVDLLFFIVFVIFAPYILVGVLLNHVLVFVAQMFRLPVLTVGVAFANLGVLAWMNSIPDPEAQFLSLAEMFGQSSPLGIPIYYLCFAVAAVLILGSYRWTRQVAKTEF